MSEELTTLHRPVGRKELELIRAGGFRGFPPRLPAQPFFYPVLKAPRIGHPHSSFQIELRGGDAADQVLLLRFTFCADGEGVENSQRQCVLDGFILTVAQRALA